MLLPPFRIREILKFISEKQPKILDIGSGSHSATITKKWIPDCNYTGIDKDANYNNNSLDISAMDNFFDLDLTDLEFNSIPNNSYDIIIMSHVIEHLHNGDIVLQQIVNKLKKEGIIYIEFPNERSIQFPSMRETLNFFDDPTHCRIYSLPELCNILMNLNFTILKARTRRSLVNIMLMPVKIVFQLMTKGYVRAGTFWDFYGFADYIIAKKVQ